MHRSWTWREQYPSLFGIHQQHLQSWLQNSVPHSTDNYCRSVHTLGRQYRVFEKVAERVLMILLFGICRMSDGLQTLWRVLQAHLILHHRSGSSSRRAMVQLVMHLQWRKEEELVRRNSARGKLCLKVELAESRNFHSPRCQSLWIRCLA